MERTGWTHIGERGARSKGRSTGTDPVMPDWQAVSLVVAPAADMRLHCAPPAEDLDLLKLHPAQGNVRSEASVHARQHSNGVAVTDFLLLRRARAALGTLDRMGLEAQCLVEDVAVGAGVHDKELLAFRVCLEASCDERADRRSFIAPEAVNLA